VASQLDTARIREHITVGLQTGRHSFNAAIPFDDVQWLDTVVVWLEERVCVRAMQDVPTRVISPERKLHTAERQRCETPCSHAFVVLVDSIIVSQAAVVFAAESYHS
jgi:hypothetical protein